MQTATHTTDPRIIGQLVTNCSCPPSADARPSTATGAGRLTCYVDYAYSDQASAGSALTMTDDGETTQGEEEAHPVTPPPPTRLSFDTLGMMRITDEMLRELYEAFDVNGRGGVERDVMREMMRNCFSNYGAPISESTLNSLFDRATPFRVRRQLSSGKAAGADQGLMSFNEFCVLFLGWLRL